MVVADTSCVNYAILIDEIEIFRLLYGAVAIPTAVFAELSNDKAPEKVRTWVAKMPDWFEVHSVPPVLDDRLNHLGAGEREAIVLAELLGTVLVMDELDGRLEARRRELPVTGLIGALLDAGERGLLEIPETFKKLQETTFRLSPTLVKRLLGRR